MDKSGQLKYWLLLALLVSGLFLYLSLRGIEWEKLWAVLLSVQLFWLLPLWLGLLVFVWLTGVRWNVLLLPQRRLGWWESAPALMAGFAGNNIFPARIGEVLRVVMLSRAKQLSFTGVLTTVAADRLFDVLAIVWLALATLPFLPPLPDTLRLGSAFLLPLAVVTLVSMMALVWRPQATTSLWKAFKRWLPGRVAHKGDTLLNQLLQGMQALRLPKNLTWVCLLSIFKWAAYGAMIICSMAAIGKAIPFQQAILVLSTVTFLSSFPSLPGFIGVTQLGFLLALEWLGISKEEAFAGSVVFWLGQWVPLTIIGGGIALTQYLPQKKQTSL